MTVSKTFMIRTNLTGLPVEELRRYRSLRKVGMSRRDVNFFMFGRCTALGLVAHPVVPA